jgi:hypothetical protein
MAIKFTTNIIKRITPNKFFHENMEKQDKDYKKSRRRARTVAHLREGINQHTGILRTGTD